MTRNQRDTINEVRGMLLGVSSIKEDFLSGNPICDDFYMDLVDMLDNVLAEDDADNKPHNKLEKRYVEDGR